MPEETRTFSEKSLMEFIDFTKPLTRIKPTIDLLIENDFSFSKKVVSCNGGFSLSAQEVFENHLTRRKPNGTLKCDDVSYKELIMDLAKNPYVCSQMKRNHVMAK